MMPRAPLPISSRAFPTPAKGGLFFSPPCEGGVRGGGQGITNTFGRGGVSAGGPATSQPRTRP